MNGVNEPARRFGPATFCRLTSALRTLQIDDTIWLAHSDPVDIIGHSATSLVLPLCVSRWRAFPVLGP